MMVDEVFSIYIVSKLGLLLNSLQKNIQALDEISILLESASNVAWAAL